MKVLISGASGLIGSALRRRLSAPSQAKAAGGEPFESSGSSVTRLVRKPASGPSELSWRPGERLDPALVSGFDVVINLAGRSLAGRWTASGKREIRDSRLAATGTIARAVAESFRANGKPAVLVSASAVGYYGNRGSEWLSESSGCGTGFLAGLCRDWESAAMEAAAAGVRVLTPRFGLVLSREGGALAKMLPPFAGALPDALVLGSSSGAG